MSNCCIQELPIYPVNEIQESFKCVKCNQILRDPLQTECGCRICKHCATKCLKGKESCPCPGNSDDCTSISWSNLSTDKAILRDIAGVKVKCSYFSQGCNEIFSFRNIDSHHQVCTFRNVSCPTCNKLFNQNELQEHAGRCPQKIEECSLCKNSYTLLELSENHYNLQHRNCCEIWATECPYCHTGNFNKTSIHDHYDECPNKSEWIFGCKFEYLGCNYRDTEAAVKEHTHTESSQHLDLAVDVIKEQSAMIEELSRSIAEAQSKINELHKNFNLCKELVTQSQMATADILSSHRTQSFDSADGVNYKSNVFRSIDEVLRQSAQNKGPNFIWKIQNYRYYQYQSEFEDKLSIFSPPFYTSEFGYKICVRVYPNGDGSGKNNFLSLFIVILQGEYDEIQAWPFNKLVTLSIIDQSGRRNVTEKFRSDPASPCFHQPINRRHNVATGCPRFIEKSKLTHGNYLSDNDNGTLYVQVKCD